MNTDTSALPEPPPGYKYTVCRYCDKPLLVGAKNKRARSHTECGVNAAVTHARQMNAKSGPAYDRWRAGMAIYAKSLDRGSAPPNG